MSTTAKLTPGVEQSLPRSTKNEGKVALDAKPNAVGVIEEENYADSGEGLGPSKKRAKTRQSRRRSKDSVIAQEKGV
jgi:hypothetical protein